MPLALVMEVMGAPRPVSYDDIQKTELPSQMDGMEAAAAGGRSATISRIDVERQAQRIEEALRSREERRRLKDEELSSKWESPSGRKKWALIQEKIRAAPAKKGKPYERSRKWRCGGGGRPIRNKNPTPEEQYRRNEEWLEFQEHLAGRERRVKRKSWKLKSWQKPAASSVHGMTLRSKES